MITRTLKQKLSSSKFWLALAGTISGVILMFGYSDSVAETVSGAVITLGSAITYIITEGSIDRKSVKKEVF